ncbi:DUF3667 domain-containing protein [Alterisphingorhabdus coralli]|uniref:DUF3667 domain-containing protein n=1 Tax=Alterisphingorhabdus coralli TaxID=3071408 RepID=A0AA97I1C3_9SPHN|nr:DUF3667 domain-containing protein [Parasphingorhabdus sp. SCSIO 66989]WOE74585.1 DUF3667 domain-containing protein [Parasphingorhabdus sp. SCSIO 66989]
MSSEFEAIGTMAEGSMAGRVFEKRDGETAADADHPTKCLNCGTVLVGSHCHACGQPGHVHRSISAFWHDILHGVLHFDGKFWNTLPLLAWKPGELTRRYVHGERAKFISPMALFLFTIFMMFAIFSFVGSPGMADSSTESTDSETVPVDWSWQTDEQSLADLEAQITEQETQLEQKTLSESERSKILEEINAAKGKANAISFTTTGSVRYPELIKEDGEIAGLDAEGNVDTGVPWLNKWVTNAAKKANSNPELLLYKLKSNGYKFAWLLIPLSIPFVWLVTIGKRGHRFYDHAVFTTYSLSFMSLLFIACALSVKFNILPALVITASVLYAPFHLYRQLRHAYGFSRIGTVLRFFVLFACINLVAMLFFAILLALGLLG